MRVSRHLSGKRKRRDVCSYDEKCGSLLDFFKFSRVEGLLSLLELQKNGWNIDRFSVFTVKPLHLLHLSLSKKIEASKTDYTAIPGKDIVCATKLKPKRVAFSRTLLFYGYDDLSFLFQKGFPDLRLQVDLSPVQNSSHFNGFFSAT